MKLETNFGCTLAVRSLFLHVILLCSITMSLLLTSANASGNETDRLALLKFKESILGDPRGVLNYWNGSTHFCEWPGVACSSRHPRITALNLEGYQLRGTISPSIGNLSFLRFVNLGNNRLFGEIPQQVSNLFRLRYLNLSVNILEGEIPVNLSYCSQLRVLSLQTNTLSGTIPWKFGSLANLVHLNLHTNNLTGAIPASLGNISGLEQLDVSSNNLSGTVPNEIGRLKSLTFFSIGPSDLYSPFPQFLLNMSLITTISMVGCHFYGTLPSNIGLALPNLKILAVGGNEFSGIIPESFSNASQLTVLSLSKNNFRGQVPAIFGNLQRLQRLYLGYNNLGSNSDNSLEFIGSLTNCSQLTVLDLGMNNFSGVLPNSVANLSHKLNRLYFLDNQISGTIPTTLENLVNLIVLAMANNLFTGVIPTSLGKLKNLGVLYVEFNAISGKIPSSMGNLTRLYYLSLAQNKLEGSIPVSIANCKNLQFLYLYENSLSGVIPREVFGLSSMLYLDLSQNAFSGSLPVEVQKLKNIVELMLSENNLTNEIPEAIGDCTSLQRIDLYGNSFQGPLPSALASLINLEILDLSRNNLTGKIPKDLEKLRYLWTLNLSFNHLEGEVPTKGVFRNLSGLSIVGNNELCGGVPELKLPGCPNEEFKHEKRSVRKLMTIVMVCVAVVLVFSAFIIFYWRRGSVKKSLPTISTIGFLSKVSYSVLYKATNAFSPTMLIGAGSFSSVYKGILDEEDNPIAVKVLNLQKKGAEKSFVAECKALRTIRHRNLLKVLTCCSSTDYNGNDFKALVFEYMANGSLEKWLHHVIDEENQSRDFIFIQRLNIAIDVASAIQYLHVDCNPHIIHCDLKPSNVLLDSEMIGHVSDFGLARLISNADGLSDGQTSTTRIKGTIGYVAPEYATGGEPSKEGDAYSYGNLLLEMFTGRRPTDDIFKDDFNLHNFVKMALPERLAQIVDSALFPQEVEETAMRTEDAMNNDNNEGDNEINKELGNINSVNKIGLSAHMRKSLVSVLEIGLACSQESPDERMNMGDAITELQRIKKAYESVGIRGQRRRIIS